jgi:hypothetical protein
VEWTGSVANNRVWVFVDLCPVDGSSPGAFARAVISGATATAGSIDAASLNGRGFYVTANLTTVTASLGNAAGQFNWCAYGSDFPPNAVDDGSGGYILKGSLPFAVTTTTGALEVNAYGYTGGTVTALTDATGEPGVLCGGSNESAGLLGCCKKGLVNCDGTCKSSCAAVYNAECQFPCIHNWDKFDWPPVHLFQKSSIGWLTENECRSMATELGFKYYLFTAGTPSRNDGVACCMCVNTKLK